MNTFIDIGVC